MSAPNGNLQSPGDEFTFTVVSGEEQPKQPASEDLPTHIKYLQDKLSKQKARRKRYEEQQAREESLRQLLAQAQDLNRETETRNTQAAVLLSALQSLETDYRESEQAKQNLLEEIHVLKQQSGETQSKAQQSLASLDTGQQALDQLLAKANNIIAESAEVTLQSAKSAKLAATTQQSAEQIIESVNSQLSELESARCSYNGMQGDAQEVLSKLAQTERDTTKLNRDSLAALETSTEVNNRADDLFARLETGYTVLEQQNQAQVAQVATTERLNDTSRELIAELKTSQAKNTEQLQESAALVEQWQQDHQKSRQLVKQLKSALTGTLEKLAGYEKSYAALQESSKHSEVLLQQQQEALERSNALLLKTQQQTAEQSLQFTDAMSNFSRGYETTQQQLQQSQRSITQLLERNQLLEQENKMLQQRVNIMSAEPKPTEPDFNFSELLNTEIDADLDSGLNTGLNAEAKSEFQAASRATGRHRKFFGLALIIPLLLAVGAVLNEAGTLGDDSLITMVESVESGGRSEQFKHHRTDYGSESQPALSVRTSQHQLSWSS